jgi:DNA double-strand break repair helicase HerA and related ATPase
VGVYFVTQAPTDVPATVLAQLGNRVQHALRAFTPDDADALRKTARTFPTTTFYDVEETITSLGIGEALVTVLSPRGVPTPLAATRLLPPDSLMAALDPAAAAQLRAGSPLQARYGERTDPQSAHEILTAKIQAARDAAAAAAGAAAGTGAGAAGGQGTMTPAQYQREVQRQAREQAQEMRRAEREAERERKAAAREAAQAQRSRERVVETGVRTAGRVLTSRAGQSFLRGVFGTLFGGGRR